ncbi:MAG: hypothetical protein V8Q17_04880 [Acutalibacteraceae bacterium]
MQTLSGSFCQSSTPILQIILGVLITFLPISHGMEIEHEIFDFLFVAPLAYYGGMEMNEKSYVANEKIRC